MEDSWAVTRQTTFLFGAAYYDEYLMMKGIDHIDETWR